MQTSFSFGKMLVVITSDQRHYSDRLTFRPKFPLIIEEYLKTKEQEDVRKNYNCGSAAHGYR